MRPVMLALSTFRTSDEAVRLAIEKAKKGKNLFVFFAVDINLAGYLIGTDLGFLPKLRHSYEEEVLGKHKKSGEELTTLIARKAARYGIKAKIKVEIGRFSFRCCELVKQESPELIVTTRSRRPEWVRKLFGSPLDSLIAQVKCPVIEA